MLGAEMRAWFAIGFVSLLMLSGCSSDTPSDEAPDQDIVETGDIPDAELDEDPRVDVADVPSDLPPDVRRQNSSVSTTGGGVMIVSDNYELRLSVGPPMPVGVSVTESYRLELGPQPVQQ